ncbi:recombinase family protein [Streptomyces sp. NPDC090021]|uniref:recombinase family protein n=1 Tax=Streptomyces sp. NPDC090021 TaxID=3365919 RepID=UPI0038210949
MKLSGWAARNGVHYQTAWAWAKEGRMPVPVVQTPSGMWLVEESAPETGGRTVVYCRVSSGDQKADLDRQVSRVVRGANGLGLAVAEVVTEVGSGLDGKRRKLHRVLSDPAVADPQETTSDLVGDITEVLTLMCAGLYGQRAAENRAARAVAEATAPAAETTG